MSSSVHIIDYPGDLPVTLVILKPGKSKLQLVKTIKVFTGLDLKQSKDIVEESENRPQTIRINTTLKDLQELKTSLTSCIDISYSLSDIQDNRLKKLIDIGLGTKEDLVEMLAEKDMYSLYTIDYDKIKDFLIQRYKLISEKDLSKLLNI